LLNLRASLPSPAVKRKILVCLKRWHDHVHEGIGRWGEGTEEVGFETGVNKAKKEVSWHKGSGNLLTKQENTIHFCSSFL